MRNGLGIAALVLGILGVVTGVIPLIFFVGGILGLIGLILGLVGLGRVRRRQADNRGVAVTGTVLSGVAMIAATVGGVITIYAAQTAVEGLDQAIKEATSSPSPTAGGQVGDVVRDGEFSIKVLKVGKGRRTVGSGLTKATARGKYILVRLHVKNNGELAKTFYATGQKLIDAEGRKYDADSTAAISLKGAKALLETVNPGTSVKGVILFDVPKKVKVSALELHESPFSDGVTVSVP